jgi:hypothetical protein
MPQKLILAGCPRTPGTIAADVVAATVSVI